MKSLPVIKCGTRTMRESLIMTVVCGLFLLSSSCNRVSLEGFKGDGQITAIGGSLSKGYRVDFPIRDGSIKASLGFSGLPQIGKECVVGFMIPQGEELPTGTLLRIKLVEGGSSKEIFSVSGDVAGWRHSSYQRDGKEATLYFFSDGDKETSFRPEGVAGDLILEFEVNPPSPIAIKDLTLSIVCGGYI